MAGFVDFFQSGQSGLCRWRGILPLPFAPLVDICFNPINEAHRPLWAVFFFFSFFFFFFFFFFVIRCSPVMSMSNLGNKLSGAVQVAWFPIFCDFCKPQPSSVPLTWPLRARLLILVQLMASRITRVIRGRLDCEFYLAKRCQHLEILISIVLSGCLW